MQTTFIILILSVAILVIAIPKIKKIFNFEHACPNHPKIQGEVSCAICDQLFCQSCIEPYKKLHLCKKHLPLVLGNDWTKVFTLKTSTDDPEKGVRLYDAKKKLFEEKKIPTYIETQYIINNDQDFIETHLVVFSIPENSFLVLETFETNL